MNSVMVVCSPRVGRIRRRRSLKVLLVTCALTVLSILTAVPAAAQIPAFGSGTPASAVSNATSPFCDGGWSDRAGPARTSNYLLTVVLQHIYCDGSYYYRVKVHNFSPLAVGNRAYGVEICNNPGLIDPHVGYIPSGRDWYSPDVGVQGLAVAGVIYRPRTNPAYQFDPEIRTACVKY